MGSSTCSPDSWCRRFFIETAARKSDRSFIGPFLPDLFKVRYHCPWYLFFSSGVRRYVWSSCASSSHSLHFCSVHPIASCDSRETGFYEKSIVNTCKMFTLRVDFLPASLPRIPGHMVLFLFFGFAMSSTMIRSFLFHVVRVVKLSSGFAVNQALSASAIHNSLIPIKKIGRTLYFWYSFARLE